MVVTAVVRRPLRESVEVPVAPVEVAAVPVAQEAVHALECRVPAAAVIAGTAAAAVVGAVAWRTAHTPQLVTAIEQAAAGSWEVRPAAEIEDPLA